MRAAIYARISLDRSGEGLGVARQVKACEELASTLGADVVATFQDNDRSAYSGKVRPNYEELLTAAGRGEFDLILCWATDRLYRRMGDLIRLTEVLSSAGVTVATVKGGHVDLSSADGILRAQVLGSVSEFESRRKGERVAAEAKQQAEAGISRSSTRPFGWERAGGGRFRPHPVEARYLREAYRRLLDGESLSSIARWLNSSGLRGVKGAEFTQARVSSLLRLPRHAGYVHYRGQIVSAASQDGTIVSPELWHQAQRVLSEPDRKKKGPPAVSWLTGRMMCSKCGGTVRPSSNVRRNGDRYKTYACVSNHVSWPREALEDVLVQMLTEWLEQDWETVQRMSREAAQDAARRAEPDRAEQALMDARVTLDRLAAELAAQHITLETFTAAANALDIPRKEAALAPRHPRTEVSVMLKAGSFARYWADADLRQRRDALEGLGVRVMVGPKRTGTVRLSTSPKP